MDDLVVNLASQLIASQVWTEHQLLSPDAMLCAYTHTITQN